MAEVYKLNSETWNASNSKVANSVSSAYDKEWAWFVDGRDKRKYQAYVQNPRLGSITNLVSKISSNNSAKLELDNNSKLIGKGSAIGGLWGSSATKNVTMGIRGFKPNFVQTEDKGNSTHWATQINYSDGMQRMYETMNNELRAYIAQTVNNVASSNNYEEIQKVYNYLKTVADRTNADYSSQLENAMNALKQTATGPTTQDVKARATARQEQLETKLKGQAQGYVNAPVTQNLQATPNQQTAMKGTLFNTIRSL